MVHFGVKNIWSSLSLFLWWKYLETIYALRTITIQILGSHADIERLVQHRLVPPPWR